MLLNVSSEEKTGACIGCGAHMRNPAMFTVTIGRMMPEQITSKRERSGLIRLLLAFTYLFGGIAINLSGIHGRHDADSLLTSLISIERWTPYYWGDNRLGTLLPLLASPVRDFEYNLIVQTQLSVFAALGAVLLFQCFFSTRERGFTVRNLCAAQIVVLFAILVLRPTYRVVQVLFLPSHPYFTSLSLSLIAVAVLIFSRWKTYIRYGVAAAALLVSFWVNWTNAPLIAGFVLLLPAGRERLRERLKARLPALLLVLGAFAAMYSYSQLYPRLVVTGFVPVAQIRETASRMLANAMDGMFYANRFAALLLLASIAAAVRWRQQFLRNMLTFGGAQIILLLCLGFAIAIASSEWVIRNLYEWRYWTIPVAFVFLIGAAFLAGCVYDLLRRITDSEWVTASLCVLLFVAAVVKAFGIPSVEHARTGIERVSSADYAKVKQLGCTHMLGDYWIAWSSVFYNRSHRIQPPLWAVSLRSEETQDLWSATPPGERNYCGVCGDIMNNYYQIVFKLGPLRHTDTAGNLCLFQP
jgi:hypothetical protein